jgi:hypothetical protein
VKTNDIQTRCYRYALLPTPRQQHAIFETASSARSYWNALVAIQRWAETVETAAKENSK